MVYFIFKPFRGWFTLLSLKRKVYMTKYFSILVLLAFFSCNDQNTNFDIGSKYVDVRTTLRYIDTMMVRSYTVKLDSVRTSGVTEGSSIIAGRYHDPGIGDVSASGYFRIGLPGSRVVPHDAEFDSIKLILVDNNYSIGDTLSPIILNVHRLNQILKTSDDGFLYNTSSFGYDPEVLGSAAFMPRPNRNDTLEIDLSDTFGNELFNLIKSKDDRILNLDNFFSYFKGLMLTYDDSDNAILGFSISEEMPAIRLYYHYFNFSVINKYMDFAINNSATLQFNHFAINPIIALPDKQSLKLSSRLTDNMSFVEGGTGIVTRFEIPYLRNLRELYSNMQILRAELILEPARNTYKNIKLPKKISLYTSDRLNRFGSPIRVTSTGNIMTGFLVIDDVFQEETSYTFDITDFISSKIIEETDDIPALLLSITPEDLNSKLDRLILGSQLNHENKIKLKIYYMNYE